MLMLMTINLDDKWWKDGDDDCDKACWARRWWCPRGWDLTWQGNWSQSGDRLVWVRSQNSVTNSATNFCGGGEFHKSNWSTQGAKVWNWSSPWTQKPSKADYYQQIQSSKLFRVFNGRNCFLRPAPEVVSVKFLISRWRSLRILLQLCPAAISWVWNENSLRLEFLF